MNRNKGKRPIKPGPPCEIPNILKKDRAGFSVGDVVRNSFSHSCVVLCCVGTFATGVYVCRCTTAPLSEHITRAPCFSKGEESSSISIAYNFML